VKPRWKRCQRSSRFWPKAWRANWSLWKKTTQGESRGWARQHELEVVAPTPHTRRATATHELPKSVLWLRGCGMRRNPRCRSAPAKSEAVGAVAMIICSCNVLTAPARSSMPKSRRTTARAQAFASEQNAKVVQNVAAGAGQQGLRDPGAPEGRGVGPGGAPPSIANQTGHTTIPTTLCSGRATAALSPTPLTKPRSLTVQFNRCSIGPCYPAFEVP
jgi:hypothetical protein